MTRLLLCLLLATAAHASVTTPVRANGGDLSIAHPTVPYAFYPRTSLVPHRSSQTEMDALEWQRFLYAVRVHRELHDLFPTLDVGYYDSINLVTTRVGAGSQYEGQLMDASGGVWQEDGDGRHYDAERNVLRDVRDAIVTAVKRGGALAASLRLRLGVDPDMRRVLDLDDALTGHATLVLGPLPLTWEKGRELAGLLDTRKPLPPCATGDCALLHATHVAHQCGSDAVCNGTSPADCPSTQRAHLAYEFQVAGDDRAIAFRQVKAFDGYVDPRWSPAEACRWKRVEDHFHAVWMDGEERGDWKAARQANTDHRWAHLCAGDADPRLRVLFSCGNGQKIDLCGKKTCREALAVLRPAL